MEDKIIATSEKGEGLLSMKEGKEQEANKTNDKKQIEVCNFIKNAFCIDGEVEMILSSQPITSKLFFRCNDSKRGKMWVAYGQLKEDIK